MHFEAGVDLLLPVAEEVIDEAADACVGLQARCWQSVVEDLERGRPLHEQLAAPAGPHQGQAPPPYDAANLTLHEELGRSGVQAFADVLATRTIGWLHSGVGQWVPSGSMRRSTRDR